MALRSTGSRFGSGAGSGSPSMTFRMRSAPVRNAAGEIAAPEFWRDNLVDDPLRGRVVQHALEAVTDLNAQLAVVLGDQKQRTVIDLLAPELPLLGYAQRYCSMVSGCVVGTIRTAS